ncbi:hypothetical protein EVG20_g194 [Dentipellis fragilis]|uniref:Fungal-type protein kinase domain-containing protein n=1 Tax=Dentipellis fragilis TaxID=205917 RepID=A0A4Y9ZG10_9AGAM|nr:hypothetical protein EVG20_g194 [Dentipellis fragilis]
MNDSEGCSYKVIVRDEVDGIGNSAKHYFLIPSPAEFRLVATGRGYVALDLQTRKKVGQWLKDSWRINPIDVKEYEIYAELLRIIPDVSWCGQVDLLPYRQSRHVYGIKGRPLREFKSTKEMVDAVFDALAAHWDAYTREKILHRDISGGNILIVDEGETLEDTWHLDRLGLVEVDDGSGWTAQEMAYRELALCYDSEAIFIHAQHTGHLAIHVGSNPGRPAQDHEYSDALESFAHVITYFILRYRPWTLRLFRSSMHKLSDEALEDDGGEVIGGDGKRYFFGNTLFDSRSLENAMPSHLAGLINDLRMAFRKFYAIPCTEEDIEDQRQAQAKLRSPDLFFSIKQRYSDDAWAMGLWLTRARTSSNPRHRSLNWLGRRGRHILVSRLVLRAISSPRSCARVKQLGSPDRHWNTS